MSKIILLSLFLCLAGCTTHHIRDVKKGVIPRPRRARSVSILSDSLCSEFRKEVTMLIYNVFGRHIGVLRVGTIVGIPCRSD